MSTIKIIIFISFLTLPIYSSLTYQTSPDRTEEVKTMCSMFPSRKQLVSQKSKAAIQQYNTIMKSSFSESGTDILKAALKTQDPIKTFQSFPKLQSQSIIFVGPFALGLLILLISCPYMCCCCACPGCCPPCSCCKKAAGEPYTRCELIWPGIVLLLSLSLILAAGAMGLSKSKDIQTTIQAVGCSIAITIDDILNGNVTDTGKYFIGLQPLAASLYNFNGNLSNINGTLTSIASDAISADSAKNTAVNEISKIPTGTANNGLAASIIYQSPFNSATTTLNSDLPIVLGSQTTSGSLIFASYNGITTIHNQISQISSLANTVKSSLTGSFGSLLLQAQKSILDMSGTIKTGSKTFKGVYSVVNPYLPTITTAMTGIYGGLVGLSAFGMFVTLLLLICSLYKCRFFLYLNCFVLLWIGLISLLLVTIISAVVPVIYFLCDVTTYSFSSPSNFNDVFAPLVPSQMSQYMSLATQCINGGTGDILNSNLMGAATSTINDLRNVMSSVGNFDDSFINTAIDSAWLQTYNTINNYNSGKQLDFTSNTDKNILEKLSNPANYGCPQLSSYGDSWVPSVQPGSAISCKSSGFPTSADCFTGGPPKPFEASAGANSCHGCMETATIYKQTITNSINLNARYTDPACSTFITQLTNVYNNYYAIKQPSYTNIILRANTADGAVSNYKTAIANMGTSFNSLISTLSNTVNTIIDPQYGIIAGFNCALLGADILMVNNAVCMNGFELLFFFRLAFGMAGFGVLFSLCCITCTGVRHYKQSQVKSQIVKQQKNNREATLESINPNNQFQVAPQRNLNTRNYATNNVATFGQDKYYYQKPGFY